MRHKTSVIILAGGKGTRMNSDLPKAMQPLAGSPLLEHVLKTARTLDPEILAIVVGHKRNLIKDFFQYDDITFITQEQQLGTGHAVDCASEVFTKYNGDVVILAADIPLIQTTTILKMLATHRSNGSAITVLTCEMDNPASYGRIIRDGNRVVANVEEKDASDEQLKIKEINSGIYVFDAKFLFSRLKQVDNNNAQSEYYLTDLIAMAVADGRLVSTEVTTHGHDEITGVNTLEELSALEESLICGPDR